MINLHCGLEKMPRKNEKGWKLFYHHFLSFNVNIFLKRIFELIQRNKIPKLLEMKIKKLG